MSQLSKTGYAEYGSPLWELAWVFTWGLIAMQIAINFAMVERKREADRVTEWRKLALEAETVRNLSQGSALTTTTEG